MFRKMFHEKHRQVVHYPPLWQYTSILLNFCNDNIECADNRPIFVKDYQCSTLYVSRKTYRVRSTPHAQPRHSSRDFLNRPFSSGAPHAQCFTKNIARVSHVRPTVLNKKAAGNRGFIVLIILRNSSEHKQLTSCDACEQAGRAGSHSSDAPHAPSQPPSPSLPQC